MNKNKGQPSKLQYSKKTNTNCSHLLNNSINSNMNQSSHLDSTTIKSKQKTQNKNNRKSTNDEAVNNSRSGIHIQNYTNKGKIQARNHNNSFTSDLSSEQLLLHIFHQQFSNQGIRSPEPRANHSNSTSKTFFSLFNHSKQKQKSIPQSSYCQFKRNLLGNSTYTNKGKHINRSACDLLDEEFKDTFITLSLIDRLKVIENQMDDGLKKIKSFNEGKLLSKAKSYFVYKVAFEKVTKELPTEYISIISKIIEGYHQIVSVFIAEHKKLLESYDVTRAKFSIATKESSYYKSKANSIEYRNDDCNNYINVKGSKQIKRLNVHCSLNKRNPNQHKKDKGDKDCIRNVPMINQNLMKTNSNMKQVQRRNDYFNSPLKQPSITVNSNKKENEALDDLYFLDKVQFRDQSLIKVKQNVPKLPFDIFK